ncbi:MAG: TPM domain-containing protein [Nitrosomonas sp.]|nr:MAG: TPM domain-containing protein [Nitrosomonas sp.]
MMITRWFRHLVTGQLTLRLSFPATSLDAIERAIRQSETLHRGEICFAIEAALNTMPLLSNQTARARAIEVFSQLRAWDTEQNNGVLIYVLLADRDVEIVADRGISTKVPVQQWEVICRAMETAFRQRRFETGAIEGIQAISQLLIAHFPADGAAIQNQLSNKPVVL